MHNIHYVTLVMGTIGGVAGYLVDGTRSFKNVFASGFVGGFASLVFPPMILLYAEQNGIAVEQDLSIAISGFIGAVSWHLMVAVLKLPNTLLEYYLTKLNRLNKNDERNN